MTRGRHLPGRRRTPMNTSQVNVARVHSHCHMKRCMCMNASSLCSGIDAYIFLDAWLFSTVLTRVCACAVPMPAHWQWIRQVSRSTSPCAPKSASIPNVEEMLIVVSARGLSAQWHPHCPLSGRLPVVLSIFMVSSRIEDCNFGILLF